MNGKSDIYNQSVEKTPNEKIYVVGLYSNRKRSSVDGKKVERRNRQGGGGKGDKMSLFPRAGVGVKRQEMEKRREDR